MKHRTETVITKFDTSWNHSVTDCPTATIFNDHDNGGSGIL